MLGYCRRGAQASRRFAALYYDDDDGAIAAASRSWLVDADADAAVDHGPLAAGVSVDVAPADGNVRFTLILEAQPNPARTRHTDLRAPGSRRYSTATMPS